MEAKGKQDKQITDKSETGPKRCGAISLYSRIYLYCAPDPSTISIVPRRRRTVSSSSQAEAKSESSLPTKRMIALGKVPRVLDFKAARRVKGRVSA